MKKLLLVILCSSLPLTALANPWVYHESKDEMRGTSSYSAVLRSDSAKYFASSSDEYARMTILITSLDNEKPIDATLLMSHGSIKCLSSASCYIQAKFDDGSIEDFKVTPVNGKGNMLAVNDFNLFIKDLADSKTAFIEVRLGDGGRAQFKFSPEKPRFTAN